MALSVGTGFLTSLFESGDVSGTSQLASTDATAESSSWSLGNRSVLSSMHQNVNDRTEQHSTSVRNRRASAVREVSQSEHEGVSTRIVANYNHMHALTVQYYEVVQIYRTVVQLHRADRVLFVPMQLLDFTPGDLKAGMAVVDRFRNALIRAALNRQIRGLLVDDTTAIVIEPAADVKLPSPPPFNSKNIQIVPEKKASAQQIMIAKVWDAKDLALVSRLFGRSLIRPDTNALHVPENTELLSISFESIKVTKVTLMLSGGNSQALEVPPDTLTVNLPTSMLGEVFAISGCKAEDGVSSGSMTLHCRYLGKDIDLPAIPVEFGQGTALQKLVTLRSDQPERQKELLAHLQNNRQYYSQAVFRSLDSATLTMLLSQYKWNDRPLINQVEPIPYTVAGNYLVLRAPVDLDQASGVTDDHEKALTWNELLTDRKIDLSSTDVRLIPIPTAGVFAEAVLGRSNSAEKLDITRFWNWQDSPIPLQPTEIAPVDASSRATPEDLKPGQLSSPVLNILNPTSLPAPTGMDAVLGALASLNFRDQSGLTGTQGLVSTGMQQTMQGTTDAGQLASANMKTEAQKAVSMAQVAGDIAKAAIAVSAAKPAPGSGNSVQGISGDGARINHGRDQDSRGVPGPGGASTRKNAAAPSALSSTANSASGSVLGSGTSSAQRAIPLYSHEATSADISNAGYSPDLIGKTLESLDGNAAMGKSPLEGAVASAGVLPADIQGKTSVVVPGASDAEKMSKILKLYGDAAISEAQHVNEIFSTLADASSYLDWLCSRAKTLGIVGQKWNVGRKTFNFAFTPAAEENFAACWNGIRTMFDRESINLMEFLALDLATHIEGYGDYAIVSEGARQNLGLDYFFNPINKIKCSYNTHRLNRTAGSLFADTLFNDAHQLLLPPEPRRWSPQDAAWYGDDYGKTGAPVDVSTPETAYIREADFYKFRGRGYIQTTTRTNYRALACTLAASLDKISGPMWGLVESWGPIDSDARLADECMTRSTDEDWSNLFDATDGVVAHIGIRVFAAGNQECMTIDPTPDALAASKPRSVAFLGDKINSYGRDLAKAVTRVILEMYDCLSSNR